MKSWTETTLKKVSKKVDYGYTASAIELNSGVKFLRITDIASSAIDWDTVPFCEISETDFEKCQLTKGDIVIARTGATVGYAKQIGHNPPKSVFASYLIRVSVKEEVCKKFIGILVESDNYKQYINTIAGGSAQPNANAKDLASYPFYLPPIRIQRKIAAILSAYDELIESNKRRIALLERMAEEIYREWFVRLRFPGHERVKFVKGVPEHWTSVPSSKVFHVMSGGTPNTDNSAYWEGDIPFFTPKDAGDNFYVLKTERTITQKGLDSCNSRLYKKDTIFITARGTVGKICLVHRDMAMNQTCYALSPKDEEAVYFYFLSMKNAISYIKGISKSGVFDNIIVDTFKIVPILLPPLELIVRYNSFAASIFSQIGALLESNELLLKARDTLLPRLISGKLSVENLDIQFPPGMAEEMKAEPVATTPT